MYRITYIAAAIAFVVSPAMAWDNTNMGNGQIVDGGSGAISHSRANANSASRSSAGISGVTGGAGGNAAGGTGYGGTGYGGAAQGGSASATGGSVTVNGGGSGSGYTGTIPPASAIAPSFYNGANPCLGAGASAAGQFPVFGLSFGGQKMDEVCQARELGEPDTAREVMCQDSRAFRRAAYTVGRPCADDRAKWADEHKPVPVPVKFQPSPWCAHASASERKRNVASCGAD